MRNPVSKASFYDIDLSPKTYKRIIFELHDLFIIKHLIPKYIMNILVVDDHPIVLDFYEKALMQDFSSNVPFTIIKAQNCKEAYDAILLATSKGIMFELAILDQSLPPYLKENILSGNDIAELLKKHNQSCKVVIITSHTEILVVYDILKKVNPHGIAIKSDVTGTNFSPMIKTILDGDTYQSPQVKNCVAEIWKKQVMAEEHNRQILLYLSKGYRLRELESLLNLASSTIERRVNDIKKAFSASDNIALIKEAIKQGYLSCVNININFNKNRGLDHLFC